MRSSRTIFLALATLLAGCGGTQGDAHEAAAPPDVAPVAAADTLPPGADSAMARLNASPRHGEWVTIPVQGGD